MNAMDIAFNEDLRMTLPTLAGLDMPLFLVLSDDLDAAFEPLELPYKQRMVRFLNASETWLPIARQRILADVGNLDGLALTTVFVLFEQQAASSVFGLLFELDADEEHGRGLMLDGDSFAILKYGDASVAFEGV